MIAANRKLIFNIVVAIGLVAVLIPAINWKQVYMVMASINVPLFCFLQVAGILDRWLMAFKWTFLLRIKRIQLSGLSSLKLYIVGGFFSEFLPTGLGGDLYRVKSLVTKGEQLKDVTSSIVVERILGFLATVSFSFVAMAIVAVFYNNSLMPYVYTLSLIFFLSFALFTILTHSSTCSYISKMLGKFHAYFLLKKIQSLYDAIMGYKSDSSTLWRFFLFCIVEQAYGSVLVYIASRVLNLELDFVYFLALVPSIFILLRLPISIQGIGIQEGLFMFFFSRVGMQSTDAFSLALLMRLGGWILSFSGGIIYLTENRSKSKMDENYGG